MSSPAASHEQSFGHPPERSPRPAKHRAGAAGIADQWWIAIALVGALVSGMAAFSEHIPLNGGFGWDGQFYARFAADPLGTLRTGVDSYRIQRVAPAALIYGGVRLLRAELTSPGVVLAGFHVLNVVCIVLTATLWLRIARVLLLGNPAYWLGVIGLFVNYAVLKQTAYLGALVDMPALLLGMTAVWAYLVNRPGALFAIGVATAFTWPVCVPTVAVLLLFPRVVPRRAPDAVRTTLPFLVAGAAACGVVGLFVYIYYVRGIAVVGLGPVTPVYAPLAPLGMALAAAFVAFGMFSLTRAYTFPRAIAELRRCRWQRVSLALVLLIGPALIVRMISSGVEVLNGRSFAAILVILGAARPLVAPVSHVAFFGPVLLLLLPLWQPYLRVVEEWGAGATLATLGALVIAMSPESRWSTYALPMVIVPLCVAAQRANVSGRYVALVGAIAIISSQVWLKINTAPNALMAAPGEQMRAVYARYFMNQGPYMTNGEYAVHAGVVAILAVALAIGWTRMARRRATVLTTDTKPGAL